MNDETMRRGIARYLRGGAAGCGFDELLKIHQAAEHQMASLNRKEFLIYRTLGSSRYFSYYEGKLLGLYDFYVNNFHIIKQIVSVSLDELKIISACGVVTTLHKDYIAERQYCTVGHHNCKVCFPC